MARRIIGLDLGAYSVKMLRLEAGKQFPRFEVIDAWEEVLQAEEPDGPDLLERQREVLRKFFHSGLMEAETFAIGLPAADGQMRTMLVPFSDTRKIEAVLPGLMEAEVPFDLSEMIVSWHRQEHQPSDLAVVEGEDSSIIRVAFGKKQPIAALLAMLQSAGIDPRQLNLASSSPYELVRELGFEPFAYDASLGEDKAHLAHLGAIVDFGHRATNLCVFDRHGLKFSLSFLRGGKRLTEEIAKAFNISFAEAEALKHERLNLGLVPEDEQDRKLLAIAKEHYADLSEHIARIFVTCSTSGQGIVSSVAFIGGAAKVPGLNEFCAPLFHEVSARIISLDALVPPKVPMPSMGLAFAYALGALHIHTKDSRFNFRKDEYAWRGELDFLRQNSVSLALWGLVIVCSLIILWAANSMVLDKENKVLGEKLKTTCASILGQPNVTAQKCLSQMKEQISTRQELGIPEFSAADVYLKSAEVLPQDVSIVITEMDVVENKMRLAAESPSFADIDKVVASLSKFHCFKKVETTRAQAATKGVRYNISSDIDCAVSATPPVSSSTPAPTSTKEKAK
ncbi:MAG TPA: pilus assembly protein PilM [Myxococcota bacterium]|nr:pilus assembly protein PilM [Myxococcota bacterium]